MLDKKTDILLAARKLFSEKDFTSVSMQAIAEECKMSKASIYKLFQSKEDLLLSRCHLTRSKWWPRPQDFRKIPHLHRRSV